MFELLVQSPSVSGRSRIYDILLVMARTGRAPYEELDEIIKYIRFLEQRENRAQTKSA